MTGPLDTCTSPDASSGEVPPALEVMNLSKSFGGKRVLKDVCWSVRPGEVHGLVGPNGSGKSTIIKILAGYHSPDAGATGAYRGSKFPLGSIPSSLDLPLRFVHQDLAVALELSAVDNIAMAGGYSRRRWGTIDWDEQGKKTRRELQSFGVDVDVWAPLHTLAPVERSAVAIVRALAGWDGDEGILILDEPTASLPADEVARLHDVVRQITRRGAAVVYVSHRLDDVVSVSDRVSVLRDGVLVGTHEGSELSSDRLASLMIGRHIQVERRTAVFGGVADVRLAVDGLTTKRLQGISFDVRAGEVLGIAGVLGSGREEVPYIVAGSSSGTFSGEVSVDGCALESNTPWDAQALGVGFVPADRKREAAVADLTLEENISLSVLRRFATGLRLSARRERQHSVDWIDRTGVVPASPTAQLRTFSGGNQQKAVFARVLATEPSLLVLAEPTAGVDVGARESLYGLVREQVENAGLAVLVASSDEGDLVAMCHRVLVLVDGAIVHELRGDDVNAENILRATENLDQAEIRTAQP